MYNIRVYLNIYMYRYIHTYRNYVWCLVYAHTQVAHANVCTRTFRVHAHTQVQQRTEIAAAQAAEEKAMQVVVYDIV